MWKTKFSTTKLIVKIYDFNTDSSPVGLFPFRSRLKSMKLKKPLAKTTAQQVKPPTHKKSDSKCQKCNNVKGGKDV